MSENDRSHGYSLPYSIRSRSSIQLIVAIFSLLILSPMIAIVRGWTQLIVVAAAIVISICLIGVLQRTTTLYSDRLMIRTILTGAQTIRFDDINQIETRTRKLRGGLFYTLVVYSSRGVTITIEPEFMSAHDRQILGDILLRYVPPASANSYVRGLTH